MATDIDVIFESDGGRRRLDRAHELRAAEPQTSSSDPDPAGYATRVDLSCICACTDPAGARHVTCADHGNH